MWIGSSSSRTDPPDPQREREAQRAAQLGLLPSLRELAPEALDRLAPERLLGGADGGPGVDLAGELGQRPRDLDRERPGGKLVEGKAEGAVALLDVAPLRRPIGPDDLPVEVPDDGIDRLL